MLKIRIKLSVGGLKKFTIVTLPSRRAAQMTLESTERVKNYPTAMSTSLGIGRWKSFVLQSIMSVPIKSIDEMILP